MTISLLLFRGMGGVVPHTNDIAVSYHGLGVCHMKNDQYEEVPNGIKIK